MENKMTLKEFKKAMEIAELDFNTYGYLHYANMICNRLFDCAKEAEKEGRIYSAKNLYKRASNLVEFIDQFELNQP